MDTKTPPIPLKSHEKPQLKKTERIANVSLPPLATYPDYRATDKSPRALWSQNSPCIIQQPDHRKKRLYRVLHIGATPLMHACQQGDRTRVLRLLKEQEYTIIYRDRTLRSALHYCMDAGTCGAVAAAAPELVNAPDAEGHTPLHLAVIAGDTQLVAVLLANGADVNAKDLEGHSVLHWATVCGEVECVRLILAAGARPSTPDLRGGSPLHYAAQCCGAAATAELAVPKKVGLKVLQTLLEFGADVNAKDEDGRQPILWAASAGSVEAVLALARAGGSAAAGTSDKDGLTALHCAASRGHVKCVEALVNLCGSQPDHVDDNGCSALHYAATLGHADATALILKLGADPNRQDRKGRTPALCAAAKGQLETLKILAQHGGSLHARTVRGTGIAHEAVASGRIELIRWLAKKRRSTLDVATHDGKTPLHVAALHGYLDICKVLMDHGVTINAVLRTNKGNSMTPLDAALYKGHRECAKLIQMHGGTTAQQLRTHKIVPNKAKFQVKHTESSNESNSSSYRNSRDPELYYEERWIERRTRRKGNMKKLTRRDSRSFSEEELRLSKASSAKHKRRARSESARYDDDNGITDHSMGRKQSKKRLTKHKCKYMDSSTESDNSDKAHDDNKKESTMSVHWRHAKRRHKKDKNNSSNEIDAKDNSAKEYDDDQSVSDDSLEVITVKRSLEKKCEKVMSGRRSKTPRECIKETKLTKTHKRSFKKSTKSGKSSRSDDEEYTTNQVTSPDKEEKDIETEESARTLRISFEDGDNDEMIESRYRRDATDSTSQETVERVVVTAMVHKDQMSDTPKSKMKTVDETSSDKVLNKETLKVEDTKKPSRDNVPSDKNQINELTNEKDISNSSKEKQQLSMQKDLQEQAKELETVQSEKTEISPILEESQEDKVNDVTNGRLNTLKDTITINGTLYVQDTSKDKSASLHVNISESKPVKDVMGEQKDDRTKDRKKSESLKDQKTSRQEFSTSTSTVQHVAGEEIEKISISTTKSHRNKKALARESSSKHSASKMLSDVGETQSDKDNLEKSCKTKSNNTGTLSTKEMSEKTKLPRYKKSREQTVLEIETGADFHYGSSPNSPKSSKPIKTKRSRSLTGKNIKMERPSSSKSSTRKSKFGSLEKRFPEESAIIAVIHSQDEDEDEAIEKEIKKALGEYMEHDTEHEEDHEIDAVRVLPSTSEEEITPSVTSLGVSRTSGVDSSLQPQLTTSSRLVTIESPEESNQEQSWRKQRRDSGGRDSGIEPSPRVSRIPRRKNVRYYPNTAKQQALNIDTITRNVQITLRRYHLERKIFFQLMELKRLQIRHGRANEQVLVKRQVEAFHKAGMSGPTLGVAKYDRPLTFRQFEAFLYEQLRRLQRGSTTLNFCTDAKQCTQKTHRCHHATSAYTSVPVHVTHGEEKQVIQLPAEKLDRTKRYFVAFSVKSETQHVEEPKSSCTIQRDAKSV